MSITGPQNEYDAQVIAALRARVAQLEGAVEMAINTVECDSLSKDGAELPWYRAAKKALGR